MDAANIIIFFDIGMKKGEIVIFFISFLVISSKSAIFANVIC